MSNELNMSDEEFMEKMNNGEFDEETNETEVEPAQEEATEEPATEEDTETDLEQPVTDSSSVSEEDDVDSDVTEDPADTEDKDADPIEPEDDGKSDDAEVATEDSKDDVLTEYLNAKSKIKASGAEFEFTNQEKLDSFDKIYQQAMDYTKKTQAIAPFRKRINVMEEAGMTDDQFNTMMDVLKGDKNAIESVIKQHGIETIELDTEAVDYTPNSYGKSDKELDIDETFRELSTAPKGEVTTDIISRQWDDNSRAKIVEGIQLPNGKTAGTVDIIKGLQYDVENGIYEQVLPEMLKIKQLDGARKSDVEYYIEAGAQMSQRQYDAELASKQAEQEARIKAEAEAKVIAEAKAKQEAAKKAQQAAERKKAAGVSHGATGATKTTDYLDMDNMSDEEFMAFMDKQIG